MISIRNITKQFGMNEVLKGVTCDIKDGELLFVLGPSGAGKSTLLRCINGLVLPTSGSIYVNEVEVTKNSLQDLRKDIGFIFQNFNVVNNMSVMDNVLVGRLGYKSFWNIRFSREDRQIAKEAIELVGLCDKLHVRADKLSGGQKQRIGIARALVQKPRLILADEPVSNLDPVIGLEILSLLQKINQSHGTTIVCNIHHVDYAKRFGNRILGINNGKVVFEGAPQRLNEQHLADIYASRVTRCEAEIEIGKAVVNI